MALCKKRKKTLADAPVLSDAGLLADSLTERAGRAAEWVAPRVVRARHGVLQAARGVQDRIEPTYEVARSRVVEDYLPRAQRAAVAAQAAAHTPGSVAERAQRAAVAARQAAVELPAPSKSRRALKTLGWLAAAGVAGAAAYVVWRRSQPVEDPWAEEYWADSTVDEPVTTPVNVGQVAEETKDDVAPAVENASEVAAEERPEA